MISPNGQRFRSTREVENYLKQKFHKSQGEQEDQQKMVHLALLAMNLSLIKMWCKWLKIMSSTLCHIFGGETLI